MSLYIGDFQALGTYDNATGTITISSDLNGYRDLTSAATTAQGGDPEGVNFHIKVVYQAADYDTPQYEEFERGEWTYSLDGADETLIRSTTLDSSTGSAINFNAGTVRVYGVAAPEKVNGNSSRLDVLEAYTDWHSPNNDTAWTYASATTFTVAGVDVTGEFPIGSKISMTNGTAKYFYVVAASFSTDTTITVTGGSDYTLANTTISDNLISTVENPSGFPQWFNYTVTLSNITIGNGTLSSKFCINGRLATVKNSLTFGSTTSVTGTGVSFSTPVAMTSVNNFDPLGTVTLFDSGTTAYNGTVVTGSTTVVLPYAINSSTTYAARERITGSIPFTWTTSDIIGMQYSYEI